MESSTAELTFLSRILYLLPVLFAFAKSHRKQDAHTQAQSIKTRTANMAESGGKSRGDVSAVSLPVRPVPMKLFATWEVERTSPNCVPR